MLHRSKSLPCEVVWGTLSLLQRTSGGVWNTILLPSVLQASVPAAEGNPVVKRGSELEVTEEKGAAHKGEDKAEASKPAASKVRHGARRPEGCVQPAVDMRGGEVVGLTWGNRQWAKQRSCDRDQRQWCRA